MIKLKISRSCDCKIFDAYCKGCLEYDRKMNEAVQYC